MSHTHRASFPLLLTSGVAIGALLLAFAAHADALRGGTDYGAGLTLAELSPLAEVLEEPERFAGRPVLVEGRVTDVCQRKGCWTVIAEGEHAVRVRFKDYGFFLPKDITGRRAYVEGLVSVTTLSEKDARHYASESRDGNPDAIHGPQRELAFTASGVRLLDAPAAAK